MKNLIIIISLILPFLLLDCREEKKIPASKNEVTVEPVEIDACNLVDKNIIEKIFNVKMKEPRKGRSQEGDANKASFSECSFESEDEGTRIYLSIYVRFTPFKDEYHSTIQSVRGSFKKSNIEIKDIEDIGEVAFWGGNQLHVFKGDNHYLIITLLGINEQDEAIEKAKEVVSHVMGNLAQV